MNHITSCLILITGFILSGCSTVVEKTYRPVTIGSDQIDKFEKPIDTSNISIERVKFDGTDPEVLISKRYPNYRLLGNAGFKSNGVSDLELKQKALTSGASFVLLFENWRGRTQTGSIGNAVPLSGGGAMVIAMPIISDNYEYNAFFLGKYSGGKDRIGIDAIPLTRELQQKLERNKGVFIENVESRGSAFDANILSGDIMIKVSENNVIDLNSAGELIRNACRKGPPFTIEVLRGVDPKTRQLTIDRCQ